MKVKFAKYVKKTACMVMAALLLVSVPAMETQAAELQENDEIVVLEFVETINSNIVNEDKPEARTTLYNCFINVYCSSDGLLVDFNTDCRGTASVIGIKDVKIQKKVWYGWKTVATSTGGERENTSSYSGHILYEDAELGETYRVSCVHYADVDGYHELENEIESFVFTY